MPITPPQYHSNVPVPGTLAVMLKSYCDWLNQMSEDLNWQYKPEQFTESDPAHGKWGEWAEIARYDADWYRVVVYDVYNGDDGGRVVLTGYFPNEGDSPQLWYLLQMFDTNMSTVVWDGKLLPVGQVGPS